MALRRRRDDLQEAALTRRSLPPKRWIAQSIDGRRQAGEQVCIRVRFEEPGEDFTLATCTCGGGGGLRRPLSSREEEILERWRKRGLSEAAFTPSDLIAFLKQVSR